jgi:hypothetical protein
MTAGELAAIVDDLIGILHLEAKQLEKLIAHVEQVTTRLPEQSELAVIRSSLSELHHRLKKLQGHEPSTPFAGISSAKQDLC